MNVGGIETWLMHVLRRIDRQRYQMDFLVQTTEPGVFDDEIRKLGSKVIPCPNPKRPLNHAVNFFRAIKANGPYDIIHSHVHPLPGWNRRNTKQNRAQPYKHTKAAAKGASIEASVL